MRRSFESGYSDHRAGKVRAREVWRILLGPLDAAYYLGVGWSILSYWGDRIAAVFYLSRLYVMLVLKTSKAPVVQGTSVVIPTKSYLSRMFQLCIRSMSHSELPGEILVFQVNQNFSYPAVINKGIRASNGKFIVIINDDCFVTGNWLSSLVRLAETGSKIGIVASKLLQPSGKIFCTEAHIASDGKPIVQIQNPELPHEIHGFAGSAILIKREVIDQIGGFDEIFSPYTYEDTDFCYRARANGWQLYYCPNSEVYHIRNASIGKEDQDRVRQIMDINRGIFLQRWKTMIETNRL